MFRTTEKMKRTSVDIVVPNLTKRYKKNVKPDALHTAVTDSNGGNMPQVFLLKITKETF